MLTKDLVYFVGGNNKKDQFEIEKLVFIVYVDLKAFDLLYKPGSHTKWQQLLRC